MVPGLVESGQAVVNHSQIAQHDALQAGVPQVSSHGQRRLELFESLREPSLHLVQQAEVASYVAFQLPVRDLLGDDECRFVVRPGFVHPSRVDVENTQVGKDAALPLPVACLPGRGKRLLELSASLAGPAEEDVHGAETVVSVALQRPVLQFARYDQGLLELRASLVHPTRAAVAGGKADARAALAAPVPNLAGLCQRRGELRLRLSVLSGGRQRAPRNPVHLGRLCKTGRGEHGGREIDPGFEWTTQAQRCPGALEHARCHIGVAPRRRPATSRDEIVEIGTGIGGRRLVVEARKIRGVSFFHRQHRRRTAPRVAVGGAQVLGRVLLHAHEKIEAIIARVPDQRLLHQRLQRVYRPRCVVVVGQIEDRLHGFERESALEHRQLSQRGFLRQRQ